MVRHSHRIFSTFVVSLALTAAAAPAALARFVEDSAPAPITPQSTTTCSETCSGSGYLTHTTLTPSSISPASEVVSGNGYGPASALPLASKSSHPVSEVASGNGYGPSSVAPTVIHVSSPSSGFDWGDAGIGAGGAVALTMLAAGGLFVASSSRRRGHSTPPEATT